jgi:hypothetical protein
LTGNLYHGNLEYLARLVAVLVSPKRDWFRRFQFRFSLFAACPQEHPMRSVTVTNTNVTVFGNVQGCVVKAIREGFAPARPHLMSHDWLVKLASPGRCSSKALKRRLADAVAGAARLLGMYSPTITGLQLCRQPVLSSRQPASVRG